VVSWAAKNFPEKSFQCETHECNKVETQHQQKKHKNSCRSRKSNPGPLAPKSDALPLHHRVN